MVPPDLRAGARHGHVRRAVDRRQPEVGARVARDHGGVRHVHPVRRPKRDGARAARRRRDERFWKMDLVATAIAGMAVISVIIGAFIVELARGHDGNPYGWLGAVAGITYLIAIVVLRLRL